MSSNNFLTVKTHLSEFKNTSDKDTLSEASESGTSTSVTSAEDLQKLALILGLNSVEDVYQERFRVDRRRLEAMLAENLEESQTAQAFFHRVMTETNTLINWPARLKIGARSKKDPHVRVAGRLDDVKLAREKIMQLLDTRNNRVTMKIDVSYTDHSHIIGKGGLTIKRVMEETGCHIHFPDSNRTSTVEKSNQVSIAGDMERVERARARVRALTPLVFCFELPIMPSSQPLPDLSSPYVEQIQEQYKVQVMLRNRPKLHQNMIVVKGVQWEVQATMEATTLLMNFMCGPLASQTQVQMSLEISPMHHSVVVGYSSEQLKAIVKGTGAQVMFPDAADPNTPPLKKSCVTITGQIKDVYAARQQLVGSLPLVVIFDVPDEAHRVDADLASKLTHKYSVYINVRRKPKQGITSVVIRGIERCAGDIYEARRELMGGKESPITAEIPESYTIPAAAASMPNFGPYYSPHPAPQAQPFLHLAEMGYGSPLYNNPPTPGGYPSPVSPLPVFGPWMGPSPPPRQAPFHYPPHPAHAAHATHPSHPTHAAHAAHTTPAHSPAQNYKGQASWNPMSSGADMSLQPMMVPYHAPEQRPQSSNCGALNTSSQASSGYQSNFTGSCVSLDTQNISGGETTSGVGSPAVSPISARSPRSQPPPSPARDRDPRDPRDPPVAPAHCTVNELATLISDLPLSARRAPGCEKKQLETLSRAQRSPLADYRHLKAEANKAMREPVGGASRVPTPRWAGYYFSHTSPGPINFNDNGSNNNDGMVTPEKGWSRSELSRPNVADPPAPPSAPHNAATPKPCRYQQLYDLLRDVGLQKYIELFKRHELDMSTFASLSEPDLAEIGVAAFGARRKMLLLIAELQKQRGAYQSPGGQERKLNITSPPYNTATLAHDNNKW